MKSLFITGVNDCDNDPCNGHQCIDKVKGYICQCNNGYHGNNCEIKPDFCKHEPCQNGASCVNTNDGNYTCSCTEGFKGSRCEKKIGIITMQKKIHNHCAIILIL